MRLHKRTMAVQQACAEIELEVVRAAHRHKLTDGEFMQMIGSMLSLRGKHMVRAERHPDNPDEPGDLE